MHQVTGVEVLRVGLVVVVGFCSGSVRLRLVEYTENRQGGANLKSVYGVTLISTSGQI
jgi:hypothetical protein